MRTIILSIIISILTFTNLSAQKNIENKDWLIKTINFEGKIMDYYQHIIFKTDGYVQMEGRVFGRWKYNKEDNSISIESRMIKEFAGNWEIKKLTKNEFKIALGKTSMNMELFDEAKLISENENSGLIGVWQLTNDENITYLKFEKPNKLTSVDINNAEGIKEVGRSKWFYNSKDKSFIAPERRFIISGKNIVKKLTKSELVIESKNKKTNTFTKVNTSTKEIPTLTFDNNSELYKNLNLKINDELKDELTIKYEESEKNINAKFLKSVKYLKYDEINYIKELYIYSYTPIKMTFEKDNDNISASMTFREISAQNLEKNNFLYPVKEVGTFDEINFFNDTEITVKAGKFLCRVFEVTYDNEKALLYMIKDKPGVYAKIIYAKKDYNDEIENTIYELTNIEM